MPDVKRSSHNPVLEPCESPSFRALAELGGVGIWQIDLQGRTLYANPAMREMMQVAPKFDLRGVSYKTFFDAANNAHVKKQHALRRRGIVNQYEVELTGRKGRKRIILIHGAPEKDLRGKVRSMIATVTDLTDLRNAEAALRKNEQLYRRTVDAVPGGVVMVDATGALRLSNVMAREFLGQELDYANVDDWKHRVFHENGTECPLEDLPVSRCLRTGKAQPPATLGVLRMDGTMCWALYTAIPIEGEGKGPPTGAVLTFLDLTARKRVEQELQESEDRFRRLAECTNEGVVIHDQGIILDLNRAALQMFGYKHHEVLGRNVLEFAPAEARSAMIRNFTSSTEKSYESTGLRKDGTTFPVEARGRMINYQGRLVRVVALRDLTERRRADAALRASEERYRAFVSQSSEAIWRFEFKRPLPLGVSDRAWIARVYRDGYLAECNDAMARMYGYERAAEIVGLGLGQMLPREDPRNLELFQRFRREGHRLVDVESHEVDRMGRSKFFLNNMVGTVENGCLVRVWGTQRDISELKRAEASVRRLSRRLLEAQEAERRRVARELHDGVSQVISAAKYNALASAHRLNGQAPRAKLELQKISSLLDKAIQEVRRISHNLRPTVLDDLGMVAAVRSTCEDFRNRTNLAMRLRFKQVPRIISPETELAVFRILQEALTNIEKHARARAVDVRLAHSKGMLTLEIRDDGRGFSTDPAQRKPGHGLGLDHMRERAGFVGGRMDVKSGLRKGTALRVVVPLEPGALASGE
ncbi:MAG: PAS domain S-box protein [Planctomycetota bacterium]|nr:PAS domain S-box protein [Planctomycetota bacterium]